jgi:hypothetical protein
MSHRPTKAQTEKPSDELSIFPKEGQSDKELSKEKSSSISQKFSNHANKNKQQAKQLNTTVDPMRCSPIRERASQASTQLTDAQRHGESRDIGHHDIRQRDQRAVGGQWYVCR